MRMSSRTGKRLRRLTKLPYVEFLLVAFTLAVASAIVVIAAEPAERRAASDDAKRRADVEAVLDAVSRYTAANRGRYPSVIPTDAREICVTGTSPEACIPGVELGVLTEGGAYLSSMPVDPTAGTATGTGYFITRSASRHPRITVTAPAASRGEAIVVSR
ncbi:hypothetical protein L0Y59_03535 [Candidatus Uhrbacteria bacterium]|nr:hypothetical protein [Candidatus Uhrbacteria bacterium]